MKSLCWKCNFRANFGVLPLGFDVKVLIPQGFIGSPNYFGFLNNLMTLIICESLIEIGEVACVTSAWSSRGQTLNSRSYAVELASIEEIKNEIEKCQSCLKDALHTSNVPTRPLVEETDLVGSGHR